MSRQFLDLILFLVSLQGLLDLLKRVFVVKEGLDLFDKLRREDSLVILTIHDLDIDGEVEVAEETMSGADLLFLDLLWVGWRLGLVGFFNWLEVLEEAPLDADVVELDLTEGSSLLGETLERGDQFLDL